MFYLCENKLITVCQLRVLNLVRDHFFWIFVPSADIKKTNFVTGKHRNIKGMCVEESNQEYTCFLDGICAEKSNQKNKLVFKMMSV